METRRYKNKGPALSLLGLGCMRLPLREAGKPDIDEEKALELVDYAWRHGINYFDTAYFYHNGQSEKFMGRALSRYPRESYHLATKMPLSFLEKAEQVPQVFDEQQKRLGTDYFDFYLCHALNAANIEKMERLGVYDFLLQKKKEGAIRHLGFSFHDSPEVLEKLCAAHAWDFAQLELNYLDWELQRASEQYAILERYGIPCVVMEPVRGGALADLGEEANAVLRAAAPGHSIASWAVRYAAGKKNVMVMLSGMSDLEQLKDNIATFDAFSPLSADETAALDKALTLFRQRFFLPCTGCRYCIDCPQKIEIPKIFAMVNAHALEKDRAGLKKELAALPQGHAPLNCIACGRCAARCPQHIAIPDEMKKLTAL